MRQQCVVGDDLFWLGVREEKSCSCDIHLPSVMSLFLSHSKAVDVYGSIFLFENKNLLFFFKLLLYNFGLNWAMTSM